jgi:hypothetical protein
MGLILVLAAIGLRYLMTPRIQPASSVASASPLPMPRQAVAQGSPRSQLTSRPPPSATSVVSEPSRAIAITDVSEAKKSGPRGETFVVATIGMAARAAADKENIEIRVLFFDVDAYNEMHPTDAQVTYQWLTPVRDWTDPSPKYLAATYLQRRPFRPGTEPLRYGGFVVRIYCDGKLQDERSKPDTLLAALRDNAPPPIPTPSLQASAFSAQPFVVPTPSPQPSASHPSSLNPHPSEEPLPKGIPIPGKPGFVQSPYDAKFLIDVRGFPPGTLVIDPNTNKPFRVP